MKKLTAIFFSALLVSSLAACSSNNDQPSENESNPPVQAESTPDESEQPDTEDETSTTDAASGDGNILIAYFTFPEPDGIDAVARASRVVADGEVLGNTQFIAQTIQRETGGSLFAIETVQEYPARPDLMDLSEDERNQDARPELATQIENLDNYDVIFLGYPNWWADMPMPLYTFLEEYDFSGKTIIPFCPHGGSGFSGTISMIANLQPNATVVTDGFTTSRESVPDSESDITAWLREVGY